MDTASALPTDHQLVHFIGRCIVKGCHQAHRASVPCLAVQVPRRGRYAQRGDTYTALRRAVWNHRDQAWQAGGEPWAGIEAARCPTHRHQLRYAQVEGTYNPDRDCDARCTNAVGPACSCSCAGANHGAGHGS